MALTADLLKRSGELRLYTMDFSRLPEFNPGGNTIASITSVVADAEPDPGGAAGALTIANIAVSSNAKGAQFTISGGTSGYRYRVIAMVVTSGGSILEGIGYLIIDDETPG